MSPSYQPPVFVLSCERAGSTLFRFILDTHPDLCCPGELYMGLLVHHLHLSLSRTLGLFAGEAEDAFGPATQKEVRRIVSTFMEEYTRSRGKKIWCEKTPPNLVHIREIEWAFPDARYICLHRNSWDVIRSGMALNREKILAWIGPYLQRYPGNDVAAFMASWVDKTRTILQFEGKHPGVSSILYENLVADPVRTLNPVFQYLGLKWDPAMLDKVFSTQHDLGGGDFKILNTSKIEQNHISLGTKVDPKLEAQVPAELLQQRNLLHQVLGYPL